MCTCRHILEAFLASVPSLPLDFFFSSRRRHTRLQGDWSSDVCSSDLMTALQTEVETVLKKVAGVALVSAAFAQLPVFHQQPAHVPPKPVHQRTVRVRLAVRSEERRVGKVCGCWDVV